MLKLLILLGIVFFIVWEVKYILLDGEILKNLGYKDWNIVPYLDKEITVKSRQTLEKYDITKYLKDNKENFEIIEKNLNRKTNIAKKLQDFLKSNEYQSRLGYGAVTSNIEKVLKNAEAYRIKVKYVTAAGNNKGEKEISLNQKGLKRFKDDPTLLMGKGEYNKYLKEKEKEALNQKHHEYYDRVNNVVDFANNSRDSLMIKGSSDTLDGLVTQLFDRTVNSIKKIKSTNSEEWKVIGDFIDHIQNEIEKLVSKNKEILDYYNSSDFQKIKDTCEVLMSSQREFNEYIDEKVQSISKLFGTRVARSETVNNDEYNYIRPYKKAITPFTAEVSATVFASAENNPLEYVVKNFYPNKKSYPEQIRKLYLLVEELETLRDAKQVIENYKLEYQQYLGNVPEFIMTNDEAGFYSRLGFANIDESVLTVEYKFVYTSGGGLAQRSFTVPMTEETIAELIKTLENKLTAGAFAKEQRNLMTKKLREFIKKRDDYTCCNCGNSISKEPNLLLEIDHIIPVSKGGCTVEDNLQTLCWKCNRSKSNKIINL